MMGERILAASGVKAEECVSGSLDLWSKPLMETQVEKAYFVEFLPDVPLSNSSNSILFRIPNSDDMTDLAGSYMQIQLKITKANGRNLDAWVAAAEETRNSVAFINIPATSVFSAMNFRLNDELLTDSFHTYPYLSYFQNILNYSTDAINSRLQLLGFYIDKNMTDNDAAAAGAEGGFKSRAALTAESHVATFITNVFHGMWSQSRYIPALTPMSLEFIKASAQFCLHSNAVTPTFTYQIKSMKLFLRRIKVRASQKLEIERHLGREAACFPIRHAFVKPLFIDANEKSVSFENIFQSRSIPAYCVIAICDQSHYRGDYGSSPFNFGNFSLTSLKVSLDAEVYPTPSPFQPNYASTTEPNHTREYLALFDDEIKIDGGKFIDMDMFKNKGYCMYVINFGNEITQARDHVIPKQSGSCRLDISFDSTSTNPALCLLIYAETDENIGLDENRRVYRDFHL